MAIGFKAVPGYKAGSMEYDVIYKLMKQTVCGSVWRSRSQWHLRRRISVVVCKRGQCSGMQAGRE